MTTLKQIGNYKIPHNYNNSLKKEVPVYRNPEITKITNVVEKWKKENKPENNGKYSFVQMLDLDKKIAKYGAEILSHNGNVYYSYHIIWYVLQLVDPTVSFTWDVIDCTNYQAVIGTGSQFPLNTVKGIAVTIHLKGGEKLPEFKGGFPYPIRNKRMEAVVDGVTTQNVEYSLQRAFVKAVAMSYGLGYSCWLAPQWVIDRVQLRTHEIATGQVLEQEDITEITDGTIVEINEEGGVGENLLQVQTADNGIQQKVKTTKKKEKPVEPAPAPVPVQPVIPTTPVTPVQPQPVVVDPTPVQPQPVIIQPQVQIQPQQPVMPQLNVVPPQPFIQPEPKVLTHEGVEIDLLAKPQQPLVNTADIQQQLLFAAQTNVNFLNYLTQYMTSIGKTDLQDVLTLPADQQQALLIKAKELGA